MFTGKDAANSAYPTQWALNPTAYQNIDSSQVDWAALAQQWIAMKDAAVIVAAPPPPSLKTDAEEGEAPMEVENIDVPPEGSGPPGGEWNSATNSWNSGWNQWGWGWQEGGSVDPKIAADPSLTLGSMIDGYSMPSENSAPMAGYSTGAVSGPTFQHGYWTASQAEQSLSRDSSRSRESRSKSKNKETKPSRTHRQREKPLPIPPVIKPVVMPTSMPMSTIDAAKRRQLPAWIREGLEKMEREKQKAIEREHEKKAMEEAEKEKKRLEEEALEKMKAESGGQPILPPKSKFESDSEGEDMDKEEVQPPLPLPSPNEEETAEEPREPSEEPEDPHPPLVRKSREEIMQEVMLTVRRSLTEILLEVTDQEIHTVSQEELARYNTVQASRLNAMKASKSKALAAIASGLGLGAYESSSEDSADDDGPRDLSDQQLQDIIKRKRSEFERTSREIEAEVRKAEQKEVAEEQDTATPVSGTPEAPRRSRLSATPPPLDCDTPEKLPERRHSREKRNNYKSNDKVDGVKRLEIISEEKPKKSSRREFTPSPVATNKKANDMAITVSSSDSEEDSLSNSSKCSLGSEPEVKVDVIKPKKRKRSTSSSDTHKKSKRDRQKKEKTHKEEKNSHAKSKHYDGHEKSEKSKSSRRKDDYHDKNKSSRSRDYERSHKDKYRDESDEDRPKKRSKRSRSASHESRSGRRRGSGERSEERSRRRAKRSHDRSARVYDKYDRYERYREHDRRRSRSGSRSRHRR